MPKLSLATQKIRAKTLTKDLQAVNGVQSHLAKKRGVTRSAISQQLKRPYVQKQIALLLDKNGVTDKFIVQNIKEGMKADKVISAYVHVSKSSPDVDNLEANEKTTDFVDVPDWANRHKFTETALKLKGHLSQESNKEPVQILQVFHGMDPETLGAVSVVSRIERIEAALKNQLSQKP